MENLLKNMKKLFFHGKPFKELYSDKNNKNKKKCYEKNVLSEFMWMNTRWI